VSEFLFSMEPDPFPTGEITSEALVRKLSRKDPLVTAALGAHAEPVEFRYPVDAGKRWNRETGVPAIAGIALPHLTEDPDGVFDELIAFASSLPPAPIGHQYTEVFEWLRARFGGEMWIERTGGSLQHVGALDERFPSARFIHLYRDGRETAISMSKRDNFRLMFVGADIEKLVGVNPFASADDVAVPPLPEPFSRMLPDSFDIEALRAFEVPIERYGLHWSSIILRGLRRLQTIDPERVLPMAYERLVSEPAVELERLAAFLDLGIPPGWTEWAIGAARQQPNNWLSLPEPGRSKLDAACRIANRRLYGPQGPPLFGQEERAG
jgi:hypothetical protein